MWRTPTNRQYRTGGPLSVGAGLLFLLLLAGCPVFDESYHVFYAGNNNTEGFPPVDSEVYFPGDTAIVLDKPESLKKGNLAFLGWQRYGSSVPLQPGEEIRIGYEHVSLYAWWENDPNYIPYEYADDSRTGGMIITKYFPYDEYSPELVIPNELDDKPVTVIGEGAFANASLSKVTLPKQLTIIENKAFAGNWLNDIVIPDTVRSIGKLAFQKANLTTLTLGSGLESIDDYAFDGNYLTALFLPESVNSLGEGAFDGNSLTTIEISGNIVIKNDSSLGTYGAAFRRHYESKESKAGVYLYQSGVWKGPYSE
ncbi:MAG: leucine-rich repeat domain-containing protein [Treponema sp.]|jgi:hypothetical protein|nr:leucine-rich repeat domain-containing protein [Treponema sp.]